MPSLPGHPPRAAHAFYILNLRVQFANRPSRYAGPVRALSPWAFNLKIIAISRGFCQGKFPGGESSVLRERFVMLNLIHYHPTVRRGAGSATAVVNHVIPSK